MPPPQVVRRRTTVTRAPRSRARLISATNSRRFVAKPRTPHPIPQAAQLFKCRSANVRGRGARPLVFLSGVQGGYSLSRKRVSPFIRAALSAALPAAPVPQLPLHLCEKEKKGNKKPPPGVNCTPHVRQYDILSNKWGVLLCQKEYQTNDIRRNSREWL